MNLKKIIIIVCVISVVIFFIISKILIFKSAEFMEEIPNEEIAEIEEGIEDSNSIVGEGTLTSFNIEQIDTNYWKNVDEVLANDEDIVKANQLLLKTSNKDAKGEIFSTIDGKFYIQEHGGKNIYYIYDLDNVGIEFKVSEEDSVNLKIGQKTKITFLGSTDSYEGIVYYIQKIPVNEEVSVKIKLDYNENLKFGTNAKAEILLDEPIVENVDEFDIKNTTSKIGKTKIILKDSGNVGIQSFDMDALMEEYMSQMMEGLDFEAGDMSNFEGLDESQFGGELPLEFESENKTDVEALSNELSEQWNSYWNEYWNEYWKNYWKAYYEEYPIYIKEPSTEKNENEDAVIENDEINNLPDDNQDNEKSEEDIVDDVENQDEGEE